MAFFSCLLSQLVLDQTSAVPAVSSLLRVAKAYNMALHPPLCPSNAMAAALLHRTLSHLTPSLLDFAGVAFFGPATRTADWVPPLLVFLRVAAASPCSPAAAPVALFSLRALTEAFTEDANGGEFAATHCTVFAQALAALVAGAAGGGMEECAAAEVCAAAASAAEVILRATPPAALAACGARYSMGELRRALEAAAGLQPRSVEAQRLADAAARLLAAAAAGGSGGEGGAGCGQGACTCSGLFFLPAALAGSAKPAVMLAVAGDTPVGVVAGLAAAAFGVAAGGALRLEAAAWGQRLDEGRAVRDYGLCPGADVYSTSQTVVPML